MEVTALSILAGVLQLEEGAQFVDLLNVDEGSHPVKQSLEDAQCAPDLHRRRLIKEADISTRNPWYDYFHVFLEMEGLTKNSNGR